MIEINNNTKWRDIFSDLSNEEAQERIEQALVLAGASIDHLVVTTIEEVLGSYAYLFPLFTDKNQEARYLYEIIGNIRHRQLMLESSQEKHGLVNYDQVKRGINSYSN